ncbi:MAG: hypothetical protein ACFFD1_11580 [Candidatus Thorarchaeota archaeon]
MSSITIAFSDPNLGPLVAFSTEDEVFAKKIAVKAQLSVSMSKNEFNFQDAVLPFPDLGKIGFIFIFKVFGKDEPVISSISYVIDQDKQMDLYKQIPVLKRRSKIFVYRLFNFVYEGKPTISRDLEVYLQNLFTNVTEFRTDLQKHAIKAKLQKSDINWLLKAVKKDLDQAITALLLEQPVLIFGHRVLTEQVMGTLEIFIPWKILVKMNETSTFFDPAGFDLVGCSNSEFLQDYSKSGVTIINLEKGRVEGGISNKPLQNIIEKEIKPKDSFTAERFIKSEFQAYYKTINEIVDVCSKSPINIDKLKEDLSNLNVETKHLVIYMIRILYPSFQTVINQLS